MHNRFKFRVWYPDERKFYYTSLQSVYAILGKDAWITDYVIQQFTGLKDGNDKDIYEGDIVKTYDHFCSVCKDWIAYDRGEVTWLCQSFKICQYFIGASLMDVYAFCECCPCGLEIIGNIFENPELRSTHVVLLKHRQL
jgi:uncharacterized phage protein (TIGR01671 family)